VFREILRVLKPGGRVALSDIALEATLPSEVKQSVEAYVGCISGAILIDEYRSLLGTSGLWLGGRDRHGGGPECLCHGQRRRLLWGRWRWIHG
jgi:hypothetical protein